MLDDTTRATPGNGKGGSVDSKRPLKRPAEDSVHVSSSPRLPKSSRKKGVGSSGEGTCESPALSDAGGDGGGASVAVVPPSML